MKLNHNIYNISDIIYYKLKGIFYGISNRCTNPNNKDYKYYGGKGVKNELLFTDLILLWYRDKANLLRQPSIDRLDDNLNYNITNCRFIEHRENSIKRNQKFSKRIGQYTLTNILIREWKSILQASLDLRVPVGSISQCINNKRQTAYGFKWRLL